MNGLDHRMVASAYPSIGRVDSSFRGNLLQLFFINITLCHNLPTTIVRECIFILHDDSELSLIALYNIIHQHLGWGVAFLQMLVKNVTF